VDATDSKLLVLVGAEVASVLDSSGGFGGGDRGSRGGFGGGFGGRR